MTEQFRPIISGTLPEKLRRLAKQCVYDSVTELTSFIPSPKNGDHLRSEDNRIILALTTQSLQ